MKSKLIVAIAVVASMSAFADKITLKSGSVLTGKVLGVEGENLKVESDDFGTVSVKSESVVSVISAEGKSVPVTNIAPVPVPPKAPETWHGSVNAAFSAARGNTYDNSWSLIANLNRKWDIDRVNFDMGYHYSEAGTSKDDKQKSADRWEVEGQHDHFWAEKIYSYENLRWERDKVALLDSRYRVGLGGGYQWLDGYEHDWTGKWSFNQEVGANWIKEEYENNDDVKNSGFAALRYAHHLKFLPKFNDKTEFFHNFEYLPDVDDWDKYLMKADVGFTTKLIMDFDFIAKIEWEYNSKPAEDRKRTDIRYIAGLGYKW